MARPVPRHDHDHGGAAEVLAAKAALRQEVWAAVSAAGWPVSGEEQQRLGWETGVGRTGNNSRVDIAGAGIPEDP